MAFVGQGRKTHEPEIINELLHEVNYYFHFSGIPYWHVKHFMTYIPYFLQRACRQREQPQLTPLPDCTFI
jgi:hypothetical protein